MAKTVFQIKPRLAEDVPKAVLPVQDFSPERILEIVQQATPTTAPTAEKLQASQKSAPWKKPKTVVQKPKSKSRNPEETPDDKRPQGRPRREEAVKRLSSDLPAEIYDKVQAEIKRNGYTLNGFLAKVLREYFSQQQQ